MNRTNGSSSRNRSTILVVDDKRENLLIMEGIIAQELRECDTVTTSQPQETLKLATAHAVDAIMLDVQMPSIDGLELVQLLKASPATRNIPVVLITAHASTPSLRTRALEVGAEEFITRPINNAELAAKLRAVLRVKAAEDKLRAMNVRLQEMVAERTRALQELNQQLEAKNKELANILDVTSHDLRSPLLNVDGFARELQESCRDLRAAAEAAGDALPPEFKERVEPILAEQIPESIQHILAGTEKMDGLITGLLHLSRLGRAEIRIEPLDMNDALRSILATMDYQITSAGATVEVGDLPSCQGDVLQINQVFSNLLDNALKFRDPARPARIQISAERRNAQVHYHIKDNGIGMASENLERIFELFFRVDRITTSGDGLGLTSVERILERHNGSIAVQSEPGQGSTFTVTLPAADHSGVARKAWGV